MSRRMIPSIAASLLLAATLAACGATGASLTAGPSAPAEADCRETSDPGTVTATMTDFAFNPSQITAKVGDIVTFTNEGASSHTATIDGSSCSTGILDGGASDGLTFGAAGTYPFHCEIHQRMTGTIVVS